MRVCVSVRVSFFRLHRGEEGRDSAPHSPELAGFPAARSEDALLAHVKPNQHTCAHPRLLSHTPSVCKCVKKNSSVCKTPCHPSRHLFIQSPAMQHAAPTVSLRETFRTLRRRAGTGMSGRRAGVTSTFVASRAHSTTPRLTALYRPMTLCLFDGARGVPVLVLLSLGDCGPRPAREGRISATR